MAEIKHGGTVFDAEEAADPLQVLIGIVDQILMSTDQDSFGKEFRVVVPALRKPDIQICETFQTCTLIRQARVTEILHIAAQE